MFTKDIHYSTELEKAILGAIILEPTAYGRMYGILQPEAFYHDHHQLIFKYLGEMWDNNEPIDIITATIYLCRKEVKELAGSSVAFYTAELTKHVCSTANLEYHSVILRQMYVEREMIKLTTNGMAGKEAYQFMDELQEQMTKLRQVKNTDDFKDIDDILIDLYKHMEKVKDQELSGITTGFKLVDKITGGLEPGGMYIVAARPSVGKCLGKGTKVMMFDGSLRSVEDIKEGELLMGVDSTPRKVLGTTSGMDQMYKITQRNGVTYRVNSEHILSLKRGKTESCHKHGDVLNINAKDFFKLPTHTKVRYKGYMSDALIFDEKQVPIEPYFLGLWLGDGRNSDARLTSDDFEVLDYCKEYAERIGMKCGTKEKKGTEALTISIAKKYRHKNHDCLKKRLRALNLLENKHIPKEYLYNSKEIRLQLLAGIIDSDGHVGLLNGAIEITMKSKTLMEEVKLLSNTLGYRVSFNNKKGSIKSINYSSDVYRIVISGNTYEIPLKISRKRNAVKQVKPRNASMTKISIDKDGYDEYYGFEIDGDNLFLLEDCTVTHNSSFMGKMVLGAAKKNHKVAVISLEMEDKKITARIASLVSEIDFWRINRGRMYDQNEADRFYSIMNSQLANLPIKISDQASVNIGDIKSKVARLKQRGEVDVLFIDYLGLIDTDGKNKNQNREQEVSKISRGIKLMAMQYNIPVVILCQLNRLSEQSAGEKKPKLHNLRESGSLEQDADGVLFIHRDFMSGIKTNQDGQTTENEADIIIAKWRNGELADLKIGFDGPKMKFYELEQEPAGFKPIPRTTGNFDEGFSEAAPF